MHKYQFTYINQLKTLIHYYKDELDCINKTDTNTTYYITHNFAFESFLNRYDSIKFNTGGDKMSMILSEYWPEMYFKWNNKHAEEELNKEEIRHPYTIIWETEK